MSLRTLAIPLLAALAAGPADADPRADERPEAPAAPGSLDAEISGALAAVLPAIVEVRHEIHRRPELANREVRTAALVARKLRELGLEVEEGVAHTGVVARLDGKRPGPTVAVRADMDALPVRERTDLPFASREETTYLGQRVGVAHACGHDVHTAVALGTAAVLARLRDRLPGTVVFVFQPAEEGAPRGEEGGAELMVREGVLERYGIEAMFALHALPDLPVGQVAYTIGPTFAAVDHFYLDVVGKQAHGSAPERGIDPIVTASELVLALQTIRSRTLPPDAPAVVTVGVFHGGTRFNIIPETVHLEGTVRTYDRGIQDTIERRMREIADGVTRAAGASFELEYDRVTPPTHNDEALGRRVLPALRSALGEERVVEWKPVMGGEDFAYFAERVPGFYFRLGTTDPAKGSGGLHTPDFRADDGAVEVGIRAMCAVVLAGLRDGGERDG